MTYFFPFRENKSGGSQMNVSRASQMDISQPDYNPNSYHGNPRALRKSMNDEPLLDSSEEGDLKKEKKPTDKKNGKKAPNKSQTIDDTTLSFE